MIQLIAFLALPDPRPHLILYASQFHPRLFYVILHLTGQVRFYQRPSCDSFCFRLLRMTDRVVFLQYLPRILLPLCRDQIRRPEIRPKSDQDPDQSSDNLNPPDQPLGPIHLVAIRWQEAELRNCDSSTLTSSFSERGCDNGISIAKLVPTRARRSLFPNSSHGNEKSSFLCQDTIP